MWTENDEGVPLTFRLADDADEAFDAIVGLIDGMQAMPLPFKLEPLPAAKVDGATEWDVFSRIVLPLARPILIDPPVGDPAIDGVTHIDTSDPDLLAAATAARECQVRREEVMLPP